MTFGNNLLMTLMPNGNTESFELIDQHLYLVLVITSSGVADIFVLIARKDLIDHSGESVRDGNFGFVG